MSDAPHFKQLLEHLFFSFFLSLGILSGIV